MIRAIAGLNSHYFHIIGDGRLLSSFGSWLLEVFCSFPLVSMGVGMTPSFKQSKMAPSTSSYKKDDGRSRQRDVPKQHNLPLCGRRKKWLRLWSNWQAFQRPWGARQKSPLWEWEDANKANSHDWRFTKMEKDEGDPRPVAPGNGLWGLEVIDWRCALLLDWWCALLPKKTYGMVINPSP